MSEVVLGVDLGTSSVKISAVDRQGNIVAQQSYDYPLSQPKPGYSEQNPEDWVNGTTVAIVRLILDDGIKPEDIAGISYSGQMHGLVLLDDNNQVLRPAILWNDTRTTPQTKEIAEKMGQEFIDITRNKALEGFTLPKILWVKENEPEIFSQAASFVTPKDYVRYRMTGKLAMEISDAAGTVAMDVANRTWSKEVQEAFGLKPEFFPEIIEGPEFAGTISPKYAAFSGLTTDTKTTQMLITRVRFTSLTTLSLASSTQWVLLWPLDTLCHGLRRRLLLMKTSRQWLNQLVSQRLVLTVCCSRHTW